MATSTRLVSSVYHTSDLLRALLNDYSTILVTCSDGSFPASSLLLAAISPLIREIGKQTSELDCSDVNLFLPDFTVQEVSYFVHLLTSTTGPIRADEERQFTRMLTFFGQKITLSTSSSRSSSWLDEENEAKVEVTREENHEEENFNSEEFYDENSYEDDDDDEEDDDEEEDEDSLPIKPQRISRRFKKTGKFTEEVRQSYDEKRRLFICNYCGEERKRSDRLALHLKWHEDHPGDNYQTRNNCKICGRFNATFFMLKMHMTRMHTDMPKTFKCPYDGCKKAFRFKGELKIHGMTHSKERNFVCTECGERFRSKGQVELHATRRHNPDMRPSIPCEECGKLFRIQADLRNHLSRTHRARLERKHRCNECDLTFRSEKSLISHLALHDPGRPLKCSVCTLRYKNKDSLVAHEKTHGNAQYACEFCTIAFKRKDNLKRHIKSKHQSSALLSNDMTTILVQPTKPYAASFLRTLSQLQQKRSFANLRLMCRDGCYMSSAIILASVSPLLRDLGQTLIGSSCCCEDDISILLPDFTVHQTAFFIQKLTSDQGPVSPHELNQFGELLNIFTKEAKLGQSLPVVEPEEDKLKVETVIYEDNMTYEEEEEELSDSQDFESEEEDKPMKKRTRNHHRRRRPSASDDNDKGKLRDLVRRCMNPEKNTYVCFICGSKRNGARSTQQHLMWHEKHPNEDFHTCHICKQCGKVCADYNAMKFHVRQVHCDRTLKCTYENCHKLFKTQVALKSHLDIHAGVKNYVCSECGFAFRSKQEMKGHILRKHSHVKKSIPCELCGKLFRHMSNLKSHFNIHKAQSERAHKCHECSMTFKSELTLQNHMMLHDPQRPFKCSKCPLRYKNKDALVSHENSHDNPQFACEHCDVVYTRKDNLKRHLREKHTKLSLLEKVIHGVPKSFSE